jgi:hypothetical protein
MKAKRLRLYAEIRYNTGESGRFIPALGLYKVYGLPGE